MRKSRYCAREKKMKWIISLMKSGEGGDFHGNSTSPDVYDRSSPSQKKTYRKNIDISRNLDPVLGWPDPTIKNTNFGAKIRPDPYSTWFIFYFSLNIRSKKGSEGVSSGYVKTKSRSNPSDKPDLTKMPDLAFLTLAYSA